MAVGDGRYEIDGQKDYACGVCGYRGARCCHRRRTADTEETRSHTTRTATSRTATSRTAVSRAATSGATSRTASACRPSGFVRSQREG